MIALSQCLGESKDTWRGLFFFSGWFSNKTKHNILWWMMKVHVQDIQHHWRKFLHPKPMHSTVSWHTVRHSGMTAMPKNLGPFEEPCHASRPRSALARYWYRNSHLGVTCFSEHVSLATVNSAGICFLTPIWTNIAYKKSNAGHSSLSLCNQLVC